MLWVKKEKISKVWPLVCAGDPKSGDIRKFENLGTRSFPIEQGIGEALNFHNAIGTKRKEERIRYLKDYWALKAKEIPGVRIHTSLKAEFSCALAGVSVQGLTPGELERELMLKYKIHTSPISLENIHLVRVSPHVYTKLSDLDRLVEALKKIASQV
jgi:selenocysteine lyase/cysteine desulfurase